MAAYWPIEDFRQYQRSVLMLFMKSFYEVVGMEHIERIVSEYALGQSLYLSARGDFALTGELIAAVEARMRQTVQEDLPITRTYMPTVVLKSLWKPYHMEDKIQLNRFTVSDFMEVYDMGGYLDSYYGPMCRSTGELSVFALHPYGEGLLLQLPPSYDLTALKPMREYGKLYQTLKESSEWNETLGIRNVGELNREISAGGFGQLILVAEALQEHKIVQIAEQIKADPEKKLIMIAGPSSSGKTSFANRLAVQLKALGLRPHMISTDDYYVNRADNPKDEDGNYDFETLEACDTALFGSDMRKLLAGEEVELPTYNFKLGVREYRGHRMQLAAGDVLVVEGIHCLNDRLTESLPQENKFRIYISALTTLNLDDHNRIPTTDARLLRRMVRDARTRGYQAQDTIRIWPSVRRGEERYIFPYQESVDVMFNSTTVYELAALKQYAQPLLFQVPEDSPEYREARRLQGFLEYLMGVDCATIPNNSLVREFVGGSVFQV